MISGMFQDFRYKPTFLSGFFFVDVFAMLGVASALRVVETIQKMGHSPMVVPFGSIEKKHT